MVRVTCFWRWSLRMVGKGRPVVDVANCTGCVFWAVHGKVVCLCELADLDIDITPATHATRNILEQIPIRLQR